MLTLIHAASLGFSTLPGKSTHHDESMCPSEMPPPAYTGPVDAVIDGRSTSCLVSLCFPLCRLHFCLGFRSSDRLNFPFLDRDLILSSDPVSRRRAAGVFRV